MRERIGMSQQNLSGQTLGQYQLRELIGVGGMGTVYRGYQANLQREVAIKILPPNLALQAGYIERFNREAATAAALEHPHIVPIYDYGTQQGTIYVVMRLLPSGTLAERIAHRQNDPRPLPSLTEASNLLNELASAIDYAHEHGVIHRDIKPSNVMFDNQGRSYLVDFGIAKLLDATSSLTSSSVSMGTPSYMSPEQWRGEELLPASDQYALGVLMYSLVTGRPPFEANTPFALMHKHLYDMPTPPQILRSAIPEAVTEVLNRAMAKTPQERFPNITSFAQAFERATKGIQEDKTAFFTYRLPKRILTTSVLTPSQPNSTVSQAVPAKAFLSRQPVAGLLAVLLVVIIGILAFLAFSSDDPSSEADSLRNTISVLQSGDVASQTTETHTPEVIAIVSTSQPTVTLNSTLLTFVFTPTETSEPSEEQTLGSVIEVLPSDTFTPTVTTSPTRTPSPSPTASYTSTLTITPSLTPTSTPSTTSTRTSTATYTRTPTSSPTATNTSTMTYTPSPTRTRTPMPTRTRTPTRIPTRRPSNTPRPPEITVTVINDSANLRSGPGTNYLIVGYVSNGDTLDVIARSDDWYLIERDDGFKAWIWGDLVELSPSNAFVQVAATIPPAPITDMEIIVGSNSVWIYDAPNSSGALIGRVTYGSIPITGVSSNGRYYQVNYQGRMGWVLKTVTLNVR